MAGNRNSIQCWPGSRDKALPMPGHRIILNRRGREFQFFPTFAVRSTERLFLIGKYIINQIGDLPAQLPSIKAGAT
jgi:hypothetical protein